MAMTRLDGDERRKEIVRTAVPLFARKGFAGTTTRELAEAAGISEALLFRHFLVKYSEKFGKTPPAPSTHLLDAAINYPWPGNLRELENFVKRYVILEDDEGSLRELVEMSSTRQRTSPREEPALPKEQGLKALVRGLKDEAEMEAIADALEKTRWCRKDAAKMLGISYKALLYKMRQFNLDTPRTRRTAPAAVAEEAASVGTGVRSS